VDLIIVDDHQLVRAGLVGLFREHGKFRVVGQAANCQEALAAIERSAPDLLLLDSRLVGCNSIELIRQIRADYPDIKVVVLSDEVDDDELLEAFLAGARGYIPKNIDFSALARSLESVAAGEVALSRVLTTRLADRLQQMSLDAPAATLPIDASEAEALVEQLSPRERLILSYLARGAANKEIARKLSISEHTVRSHVTKVLGKLGFVNRVQAAAFAVQHNIIQAEGVDDAAPTRAHR
jgi:two-component system nitrate/nitrite response regulator NarL